MNAIDEQLVRRQGAAAAAWALREEIVLVVAGEPIHIPGRADLTYPFRAHSEYLYLTDRDAPGGVLAFDPADGWIDFVSPITEADRLWSGAPASDPEGPTTEALPAWLTARAGRPLAVLGSADTAIGAGDGALSERLRLILNLVRRPKDAVELERMRIAEHATAAAYAAVVPLLTPGRSERAVQIEFEAETLRRGATGMGYDSIVGSGPNAGVLHFPPSDRRLQAGELVLIDAGGEYRGYVSDVTRTYGVGGVLSAQQRELHAVVARALETGIALCRPGVEWREVHRAAARTIVEGLIAHGVMRGDPDELVAAGASWLFFPHGVGHLVGLGVRDAAGPLPDRVGAPPPFPNLRIDLPLEAGMVVTVEPGLYFVPAILNSDEYRRRFAGAVGWERAEALLGFGGIRIEQNVLITAGAPEVLTADIPLLG